MPTLPPAAVSPYMPIEESLNLARIRANDAIASLAGDLLTDDWDVTKPLVNAAWRKMQMYLDFLGYSRFKGERFVYNIPACASQDPSIIPYISWVNYFDGNQYWDTSVLPGDMMYPLEVWERSAASAPAGHFYRMRNAVDGFTIIPNSFGNQMWSWRSDAIYLGGTNQNFDLQIKGSFFLPDFGIYDQTTNWVNEIVPIVWGSDPLSYYICAEIEMGRDDADPQQYINLGQESCRMILASRDTRANQRTNVSRRPYGSRRTIGGSAWL